MAAMVTITKPAVALVSSEHFRVKPAIASEHLRVKQSWVLRQRSQRVRVVVRAADEVASVGQTPTTPIQTGNSAIEVDEKSPEPSSLQTEDVASVGQTPTSPIETGNSGDEKDSKPSSLESAVASAGQTPTAPIENGNSGVEEKDSKPSSLESAVASAGQTPAAPIENGNSGAEKARKPSPLQRGGTVEGGEATEKKQVADAGKFDDPRWRAGTWDITKFTSDGKVNWDAVIDAEVARRKWLEENPESSSNSEPVAFDTATVPWWAWVKRFHLPEAELLNGRAAMVGYAMGYLVDSATGAGLVDQQSSFLGKSLLFLTVLGVLLIRKNSDVANLRTIIKESTFYDKQWQATWKEEVPEAGKENDADAL
jgi:hypothetical protein